MYDLLGPVLIAGFFSSINLMSVHNSAKFQHCGVISVKSAVDTKNRLFFRHRALFFADTVQVILYSVTVEYFSKYDNTKRRNRGKRGFNCEQHNQEPPSPLSRVLR